MPIEYRKTQVIFSGDVSLDDTEKLFDWLVVNPLVKGDLAECTHLHSVNMQILIAAQMEVTVWPKDKRLRVWLEPALLANRLRTHNY